MAKNDCVAAKPLATCNHDFQPLILQFGILDSVVTLQGEQPEQIFQAGIPISHANAAMTTHLKCTKCGLIQPLMEIKNGNTRFII